MNVATKQKKGDLVHGLISRLFPDPVAMKLGADRFADEVRGQQHAHVKSFSPLMLLTNAVCLAAVVPVLLSYADPKLVALWTFPLLGAIFIGAKGLKFKWTASPRVHPRKNTNSLILNSIVLGGIWGLLPMLFFNQASPDQKILITCMVSGMMGGGTMALASVPVAARIFCLLIGLGGFVTLLSSGTLSGISAAILLIAYGVALSRLSWAVGERFVQRAIDSRDLEKQRATIGMLLKDFEDSSSDWMWETDASGMIVDPSPRFCESMGMSTYQLGSLSLQSLVSFQQPRDSSELRNKPLSQKLTTALLFRNHKVMIETGTGPRWWSLTGKPIVDDEGQLTGFRGTASDIQETKNAEDKLKRMARFDPVTGLCNRSYFHEQLAEKALPDLEAGGHDNWAILLVDLDGFKSINASLGHFFGDVLLREAANRIQVCIGATDISARFGADQFCVFMTSVKGRSSATHVAGEILKQLSRPFSIDGHSVALTASAGIAVGEAGKKDREAVLHSADLALGRAKSNGGAQYQVYSEGMDDALMKRRELEVELRQAVRESQFVLHYQAVTDTATGGVNTFEALLRWNHPTRGLVMPEEFIGLAEETGLINEIGAWVLDKACSDASRWAIPHRVAVNISAKQIMSQRLLLQVIKTLERHDLPAERLELEVTESVLIDNPERTRTLFDELRKLGVSISLDDFGTGYSSLSYLVRFPFDKVKIDKTFIQSAQQSEEDLSIIRSILGLANNLGIRTIAEGVENQEQMKIVRREGCHEMQGYLINKPKAMNEIPALAPRSLTQHVGGEPNTGSVSAA